MTDMAKRLTFTRNGVDIVGGLDLRNGKASIGGWSTHEVWVTEFGGETMVENHIADLYCGSPINVADGYGFRIEDAQEEAA